MHSHAGCMAKSALQREHCCKATVGFFSKAFLASLQAVPSFCLAPPVYRGVAYHSAAQHESITVKIFTCANFKTFVKIFPRKFLLYDNKAIPTRSLPFSKIM